MSNKNNSIKFVIIIVIICLLLWVFYIIYNNSKNSNNYNWWVIDVWTWKSFWTVTDTKIDRTNVNLTWWSWDF